MSQRVRQFLHVTALLLGTIFVLAGISWRVFVAYAGLENIVQIDSVKEELLIRRSLISEEREGIIRFGEQDEINVLLLGLDARKGWDSAHCDAIHLYTLHLDDMSVTITSVPRGTFSRLPSGQVYADTEYYLANACGYGGLEYGIEQIERTLGVRVDYYATVGFSQVYGIMRTLGLPTTESLQFLRHRRSYAIGDPQRSHNQAVFMKDLITSQGGRFRNDVFKPVFFVLLGMVDTNMDPILARSLFTAYLDAEIDKRPNDIRLDMKPRHAGIVDYHFDFEGGEDQVDSLLDRIRGVTSSEDLSEKPLSAYQQELTTFLDVSLRQGGEDYQRVIDRQLWLQIEDTDARERWHFAYLEKQVNDLMDEEINEAINLITTFIIEKETFGQEESVSKAEALLRSVIE